MKKIMIFSSLLLSTALLTSTACSSDNPQSEPDQPTPPEEQGQFGIEPSKANLYFTERIKGTAPAYEYSSALTLENVAKATEYVWGLWKKSVEATETEKLPKLQQITGQWYETAPIHLSWKVGSSLMSSTYTMKGTKPTAGYPFFLVLHGSGYDSSQEWKNMLYLIDGAKNSTVPAAYLIPRSPNGGTECRWFPPTRQLYWERVLRQAIARGDVNPNKLYFTGISEGAYGSQRLASFYADYLAGAAPTSGGDQLFNAPPENLANIFYRPCNGTADTMFGRYLMTLKAKEELDRLEQAHPGLYAHSFKIIQDAPHFSWDYHTDYYPAELLNHTRNPHPKYFYWENFGMGGQLGEGYRYREGFYNLLVLEPSAARTDNLIRDCYEMSIDNNTINLNIKTVKVTPTEIVDDPNWSMAIGVKKEFSPATKGKVRIYLDNNLVNLSKPVVVKVNGVEKFNGTVKPDTRWLVESCGIFFDPERIFPAAVDVAI